jgi:hypothetical protein
VRPVTLAPGKVLGDFTALLASRQFLYAEAYTFRLIDGTVLVYTDAQRDFTVPPCDGSLIQETYVAGDVLVKGLRFKIGTGSDSTGGDPSASIEVDEQTVTLYPNSNSDSPSMVAGVPFLIAVGRRCFDGATIQRDRWYFDGSLGNPVGGMPMFYGLACSVEAQSRTQVVLKVTSDIVLLSQQMPRNLYQPNCQYTVYSTGCGADKSAFVVHDVVGASPTISFIPWTSATTQFTAGTVFFENGSCVGQERSIRKADATGLWLTYPLYELPIAGDQFAAYPGCDRQYGGGCAFFSRQGAFRATPKVPQAVFAV